MKETGPLTPKTRPAPSPASTRSRRETSNMSSSLDVTRGSQVTLAAMLPFDPRSSVAHCSDHGKVIAIPALEPCRWRPRRVSWVIRRRGGVPRSVRSEESLTTSAAYDRIIHHLPSGGHHDFPPALRQRVQHLQLPPGQPT